MPSTASRSLEGAAGWEAVELSIVIPAFNEEARIGGTLRRIGAYLDGRAGKAEVLVADDGSRDGTAEEAGRALPGDRRLRVLRLGVNRGKGAAVRSGVQAARGRRILFSDADLSTPIEEIEALERALDDGAQVAIGSRALADSEVVVRQAWYRQTMGRTFNLFVRALALPGIRDSQCGFKLFEKDAARRLFRAQTCDGFSFDVEVLFLARKLGLRVAEVPVRWSDSPASRVNPITDSARMLRDLLRVRWNWSRGAYRLRLDPSDAPGRSPRSSSR